MNAYQLLRDQAADKRDKAISAAHADYRCTCDKIEALRVSLESQPDPKDKTIKGLVVDCIPKGESFTGNDILHSLSLAHPGRNFRKATIKTILHKLGNERIIKRVSKDGRGQIAWGDQSCDGDLKKERPLCEVIADVLKDSEGMLNIDIGMGVQRTGRLVSYSAQSVCKAVSKSLYANPHRFSKDGDGRWVAS